MNRFRYAFVILIAVGSLILSLTLLATLGYKFQRDTPFERKCVQANGIYLLTEEGKERCAKISEIFIPSD